MTSKTTDLEKTTAVGGKRDSKTEAPSELSRPDFVQQSAGNLAIQNLLASGRIQTKLAISEPGDPDEEQADHVADQVMRFADPGRIGSTGTRIHRKCVTCEASGSTCSKCEEENKIQRKAVGSSSPGSMAKTPGFLGRGEPLGARTRDFFEPQFGVDLGHVRVHTDETANNSAAAMGARAFTLGSDIAFARNQLAPETADGKRLLAHELTHVIQQSTAGYPMRIARDKGPQATTTPPPVPGRFGEPSACYAPKGQTMEFEGVLLASNIEYLDGELRNYIAKHGESGAVGFSNRLRNHVGKKIQKADDYDVDDPASLVGMDVQTSEGLRNEAQISLNLDEALRKLLANNKRWLADFEAKAYEVVLGMLQESEDRVNQERIRYGISWKTVTTRIMRSDGLGKSLETEFRTDYSMKDTPASRALAQAATGLLKRKRTFDEAHKAMEDFGKREVGGAIGELATSRYGSEKERKRVERLNELRGTRNHAKRDLDVFRSQKSAEFPILAAYASEEEISEKSLEKLELLAAGNIPGGPTAMAPATKMMGEEIKTRLEHIADARKDIKEDGGKKTKIWRVPRIIDGTRLITGAEPGTMYGRVIDDKVKDEAPGILTSILIGLLQLVLVLLAPATGGLTLIPAAAISVGQAYSAVREYERAKMLRGTDFGAMALSSEDPSLFWLAVDIIGAGFDVGAAAGAAVRIFRALAPAARAARAAKTVEATEEAVRTLERTAGELGGEALAKTVGRDARMGGKQVGETLDEAKALERIGEQMAAQELRTGAQAAESIAGRSVKVAESGSIWSCASPCTLLRERYSRLLKRNKTWESKVQQLEDEAARIPKGKAGDAARKDLAERAAALEREMRSKSLPGDWTSPLKDTTEYSALLERRGSVAAELDHHPKNWTGKDEAHFRYGKNVEAEEGYRWMLDENGKLHYDRLDASLPPHRFNPATGAFEEAAEASTLIRATRGAEEAKDLASIPKKQREAMEAAFKKRSKLIAERDKLAAAEEAAEKAGKKFKDSEKLKKISAQINEQSRQFGENAAEGIMKGKAGAKKVYGGAASGSKSGDFDQVWKVGGEYHVVEAKGGSGALGSRAVKEGVRAEQGTIEYAKSIAENMAKNGSTKEIRKLGRELLAALAEGKVKYLLVRAPIGEEVGSTAVKVSEFVIH